VKINEKNNCSEKQLLRNRQGICSTSITVVLKKSRNGNPRTCRKKDKKAFYSLKMEFGGEVSITSTSVTDSC